MKKKNLFTAAENCVICLIGAMDRLWFHQIILFPEPSLFHLPEIPKTTRFSSGQEISQDKTSSQESDILVKETTTNDHQVRSTSLNLVSSKTRSLSSSPISAQKQSGNLRYSAGRLKKTMSCKSLVELELEEVKGFMDLGFIFRKESLSKRMMSLIPGLQRLNNKNEKKDGFEFTSNTDEEEKRIVRPYLSEAWLIRRPDSPLLNLRIPTSVSTTADMKKHLKYWARTVASAIKQES